MIAIHQSENPCPEAHGPSSSLSADQGHVEDQLRKDVKADYVQLRQLLELVRSQLALQDADKSFVAIASAFDQLRDQLALHFTLKMSFGYLNDTIEVAPRLCRQAEQLQREQFLLFLEICEIADQAQDLLYSTGAKQSAQCQSLRARFESFSSQLHSHDGRERDLIYQALCDDIGVGD